MSSFPRNLAYREVSPPYTFFFCKNTGPPITHVVCVTEGFYLLCSSIQEPPNLKHKILEHQEEDDIYFKMEITGSFKDALTRQANEAVRISNCKSSVILNNKNQQDRPEVCHNH